MINSENFETPENVMTTNVSIDEIIINKCLIVDDKFEEVKNVIIALNEKAISTDYRQNILAQKVEIDPNTQLVVLDLYMGESQDSIEQAVNSVQFLNEKIKGPYWLAVWTKHTDKFNSFVNEINDKFKPEDNFPLNIQQLQGRKTTNGIDSDIAQKTVDSLLEYINQIKEDSRNLYEYLRLSRIYQRNASLLWGILKKGYNSIEKSHDEYRKYFDEILGDAFDVFDKTFNFEKSGKGFLHIHSKLLEQQLTDEQIDYKVPTDKRLTDQIRKNINSELIVHKFSTAKQPSEKLPGLIYTISNSNKAEKKNLVNELISPFYPGTKIESNTDNKEYILGGEKVLVCMLFDFLLPEDKTYNDIKNILKQMKKDELTKYFREIKPEDIENLSQKNSDNDPIKENLDYFLYDNNQSSKCTFGNMLITPFCDFAHSKKKDVFYLPVILLEYNKEGEKLKGFLNKSPAIHSIDLNDGRYLIYKENMYNVDDFEKIRGTKQEFYLTKETVNEIQINVAKNISRIGISTIEMHSRNGN